MHRRAAPAVRPAGLPAAMAEEEAAEDHKTMELIRASRALVFPPSEIFPHVKMHEMAECRITYTVRSKRVARWIRAVKRNFLDAAEVKIVGLDAEFTDPRGRGRDTQRAAVLQLSVASETLVFHVLHANEVPALLVEFLADRNIRFCGAAIHNDVAMLKPYGIGIANAVDLQRVLWNPIPSKTTPSLFDLANHHLGMSLVNKIKPAKRGEQKTAEEIAEEKELIWGWGNFPLTRKQIWYAALDARLGFELARAMWGAGGY